MDDLLHSLGTPGQGSTRPQTPLAASAKTSASEGVAFGLAFGALLQSDTEQSEPLVDIEIEGLTKTTAGADTGSDVPDAAEPEVLPRADVEISPPPDIAVGLLADTTGGVTAGTAAGVPTDAAPDTTVSGVALETGSQPDYALRADAFTSPLQHPTVATVSVPPSDSLAMAHSLPKPAAAPSLPVISGLANPMQNAASDGPVHAVVRPAQTGVDRGHHRPGNPTSDVQPHRTATVPISAPIDPLAIAHTLPKPAAAPSLPVISGLANPIQNAVSDGPVHAVVPPAQTGMNRAHHTPGNLISDMQPHRTSTVPIPAPIDPLAIAHTLTKPAAAPSLPAMSGLANPMQNAVSDGPVHAVVPPAQTGVDRAHHTPANLTSDMQPHRKTTGPIPTPIDPSAIAHTLTKPAAAPSLLAMPGLANPMQNANSDGPVHAVVPPAQTGMTRAHHTSGNLTSDMQPHRTSTVPIPAPNQTPPGQIAPLATEPKTATSLAPHAPESLAAAGVSTRRHTGVLQTDSTTTAPTVNRPQDMTLPDTRRDSDMDRPSRATTVTHAPVRQGAWQPLPRPATGPDTGYGAPATLASTVTVTLSSPQDPGLLPLEGLDFGLQSAALTSTSLTSLATSLPPQAAPGHAHAVAQQIARTLAEPGREPGGMVELALDPPELGRLRMQMIDVAGVLTLTILAERPETADLMRRHLELLANEFSAAGLDAPNVQISHGDAGSQGQSEREDAAVGQTSEASDLADVSSHPTPVSRAASGALDLRL